MSIINIIKSAVKEGRKTTLYSQQIKPLVTEIEELEAQNSELSDKVATAQWLVDNLAILLRLTARRLPISNQTRMNAFNFLERHGLRGSFLRQDPGDKNNFPAPPYKLGEWFIFNGVDFIRVAPSDDMVRLVADFWERHKALEDQLINGTSSQAGVGFIKNEKEGL